MALATDIRKGVVAKVVRRSFSDDSLGDGDKGALSAKPVYKTLIHEILDGSSDGNAAHRIAFAELEFGRNLLSHAELSGDDLLTEIVFYL